MCGILGMIAKSGSLLVVEQHEAQLQKALSLLSHRGPDGSSVWSDPAQKAWIAHCRLAIVGLQHATQPMVSQNGSLVIIYNGEIYNYLQLRKKLEGRGYRFRSDSDTEVVLAMYEVYGHECLESLHGMFAFAIYDQNTGELFAARDRYGIKPFYYSVTKAGHLCFGSEIRPLIQSGLVSFEPAQENFNEYLIFGYVTGEQTLFHGISELKPGHFLKWRGGTVKQTQFWQPFSLEIDNDHLQEQDLLDELDQRLNQTMDWWTVGDFNEVATLTSAGVDSSLVTRMAVDRIPGVNVYTAYFPDHPECDERPISKLMTDQLKCRVNYIPLDTNYISSHLEQLARHVDDPIHDSNALTLMAICEAIRRDSNVKVVFCGEGADEVFGGYGRHAVFPEKYRQTGDIEILNFAYNTVALPRLKYFSDSVEITNPGRQQILSSLKAATPLGRLLEIDQRTFLTSYLHRQDRIGMMFGIEIRTPYLEHHYSDFVNALPDDCKISGKIHKYLHRRLAERYLPHDLIWAPVKFPFVAPVSAELKAGPLHEIFIERMHKRARISDYYDMKGIHRLLADHRPRDAQADHQNTLWRLLTLELWLSSWR